MNAPIIQARELSLTFAARHKGAPPIHALSNVNLTVAAGAMTALVGPDGAGKTSLMRLLSGLLVPTVGELTVLGTRLDDNPRSAQAVQNRISYMPQKFGLYEDLSVRENFELYADLHGVARDERETRYRRLMQMTDLTRFADRLAGKLSGGMKQKLGLMCTLVRSPELLLLDEPTVGVDPLSRRELWQIVQQMITDERLSVVLATTYLDEAEQCAQVYVLSEGLVLAQGTPAALTERAQGLCYTARAHNDHPRYPNNRLLQAFLLDQRAQVLDAVPQNGGVRVIRQADAPLAQLQGLVNGIDFVPAPARLEDGVMVVLRAVLNPENTGNNGASASSLSTPIPEIPANDGQAVIEVKDLVRKFGDFTAVDNTSFTVRRGEIFGLLGPNGAGKTTTFRMLCGLLPASSGQLRVAGVDLRRARAQARQRVGYVAQKFSLYGSLTVRENLTFFGQAYGLFAAALRTRMAQVSASFGLDEVLTEHAGSLPGGYKQRLAMAVGVLHAPDVLFLDEPTSGADALARRDFWRRITALAQVGTTVVITTHFMEEAEYCDRMVIQDAGKILALGTPDEVRRQANGDGAGRTPSMDETFIAIVEQARNGSNASNAPNIFTVSAPPQAKEMR